MGSPILCWTDTDTFFLSPGIPETIRIYAGIHFLGLVQVLFFRFFTDPL